MLSLRNQNWSRYRYVPMPVHVCGFAVGVILQINQQFKYIFLKTQFLSIKIAWTLKTSTKYDQQFFKEFHYYLVPPNPSLIAWCIQFFSTATFEPFWPFHGPFTAPHGPDLFTAPNFFLRLLLSKGAVATATWQPCTRDKSTFSRQRRTSMTSRVPGSLLIGWF
jgi:hypothetical protein